MLRLAPAAGESAARLAIVQVPPGLPRLVPAADTHGHAFVLLEEIIRTHLPQLFPGQVILESAIIRLSRDAELDLDDEGGRTHLELVEREVRRRRRGDVIRLEIEDSASEGLIGFSGSASRSRLATSTRFRGRWICGCWPG